MSRSRTPPWYHPGDVAQSVRDASRGSDISTQEIVDVLQEHEFEASRDRIRRLVETTRDRLPETENPPAPDHSPDEPRTLPSRFIDAADIEYYGTRDFALILGVALARYEGSFRIPEAIDGLSVDLFWNRQHTTVAFKTIVRPTGAPAAEDVVRDVVAGKTSPPTGRSPSILAIVSNGGFTSYARDLADENDIELFGMDHLRQWFTDAKLTNSILGTLLEEGDQSSEERTEILSELQPLPNPIREEDPLENVRQVEWLDANDSDPTPTTVKQRMPVSETRPPPGQRGTLYADRDEDGDFGAFDRFTDELMEDNRE